MKKTILLLLMQLMAICAFANINESVGVFTVSGRIIDENQMPLIGATVVLENTFQGTSTNLYGQFMFNKLKPGNYKLTVSFIGYEKQEINFVLESDKIIDITLKVSSIMGEEIVVSSTRASAKMPIAQSTLKKETIKELNTGFDIPFLLEMIPSVVATSEAGTGIGNTAFRIRGTDMSRINVTVNNIPLNDPESQGVFWVNMPDFTNSVDNIQVQRGVGTSTNGAAAFGATVNFQTTTLSPNPFANAEILYGSFNTWRTTAKVGTGLINNHFSFEGRFSKLNSNGYIDRGTSDHRSMYLTGAYHTEKSVLRFNLIHGEEHTGITWTGTPGYMLDSIRTYNPEGIYTDSNGDTKYYSDHKDNYTQTHYQLMFSHQLNNNISFNATSFLILGKGYYEEYKDDQDFSEYGISPVVIGGNTYESTDLIRQKWLDNNFYGVNYSLNYRLGSADFVFGGGINRYDGDHFGKILWTEVNAGIPKNYEWYRNTGVKTDINFFAKTNWQLSNLISFYGDIQYRIINYKLDGPDDDLALLDQKHSWNFINPKFGLMYKISTNQEAFFSLGIGNREPSRADLKDALKGVENNTPKPESLYDYELGYSFKHQIFALGFNVYYMNYKDQLVLTGKLSDVGYPLMTNVDKSYRTGIEVTFGFKPTNWLKWDINGTLSKNVIKNYVEYLDQYDNSNDWNPVPQRDSTLGDTPISYSPAFIGSSQIKITPVKNFDISFISKYVGEQFYDNTGNADRMLDDYLVNNLKFDYSIKLKGMKSLNLQFNINNIFNLEYEVNAWVYRARFVNDGSEYREDGFFPQAGRNFMLKLGVDF